MNAKKHGSMALTDEQLAVACKNIGFDLTCGSCACLFYTGSTGYECDRTCTTIPKREPLTITVEHVRLCEGGCGCTDSDTSLSERRHGKTICENCAWEHDHGEEDCGWQCEEIPIMLRRMHRGGKCSQHCPDPRTWAVETGGEDSR